MWAVTKFVERQYHYFDLDCGTSTIFTMVTKYNNNNNGEKEDEDDEVIDVQRIKSDVDGGKAEESKGETFYVRWLFKGRLE